MLEKFLIVACISVLVLGIHGTDEQPNLTIDGGETADISDYAYQVVIRDEGIGLLCSAALISTTWVLSTASCVTNAEFTNEYLNGSVSIAGNTANYSEGIQVDIKQFISHPNYQAFADNYDIGLIEITTPLECENCKPIGLADASPNAGDQITVTGWGWAESDRPYIPDLLQVVQLPVRTATDCDNAFADIPGRYLTDKQFCAGTIQEPLVGPCWLDEGDPAVINGILVGLVSQTFTCPGEFPYPRIFTDVSKFRDWIKENSGV